MNDLVRCTHCGGLYRLGEVTVTARYADTQQAIEHDAKGDGPATVLVGLLTCDEVDVRDAVASGLPSHFYCDHHDQTVCIVHGRRDCRGLCL